MYRLFSIIMLFATGLAAAAETEPEELRATRARYEAQRDAYRENYDRVSTAGLERYKLALDKLERSARARGNLDELVVARAELNRLEEDPKVPFPGKSESDLEKAAASYWDYVSRSQKVFTLQHGKLLKTYLAQLEKHQAAMIIADRLDDAITVRDAIKAARSTHQQLKENLARIGKPAAKAVTKDPQLPEALRAGLKLYFAFDENETIKIKDLSGNEHRPTTSTVDWAPKGKRGGAIRCKGDDGLWIEDAQDLAFTKSFTIAAWFSMDQAIPNQKEQQFLIGHSDWDQDVGFILLSFMPHAPGINFRGHHRGRGTRDLVWNGASNYAAEEWFHVAAVYEGEYMRLYFNGSSQATKPHRGGFKAHDGPLKIGEDYSGLIDELVMFDRALSDAEIKLLVAHAEKPVE